MGVFTFSFSSSVGTMDANAVELKAIRKAFQIYVASKWATHKLIIENDSENAVKQGHNPHTAPWKLKTVVVQIEFFKSKLKEWDIVKILRSANYTADSLAKSGVQRSEKFIWVLSDEVDDM